MNKIAVISVIMSCILALTTSCAGMHDPKDSNAFPANDGGHFPRMEKALDARTADCISDNCLSGNLLEDATEFYDSMELNENSAVYEHAYFILVVVHLTNKNEVSERLLEGDAMLKCSELLNRKFNLPEKYELEAISIVNGYDEERKVYDYVLAFHKKVLSKLIIGEKK